MKGSHVIEEGERGRKREGEESDCKTRAGGGGFIHSFFNYFLFEEV